MSKMSQLIGTLLVAAMGPIFVQTNAHASFVVKWTFSGSKLASSIGGITPGPAVADLNGGGPELIQINEARTGFGIHSAATGAVLYGSGTLPGTILQIVLVDVDVDGLIDVLVTYNNPEGTMVVGWNGLPVGVQEDSPTSENASPRLMQNLPIPSHHRPTSTSLSPSPEPSISLSTMSRAGSFADWLATLTPEATTTFSGTVGTIPATRLLREPTTTGW